MTDRFFSAFELGSEVVIAGTTTRGVVTGSRWSEFERVRVYYVEFEDGNCIGYRPSALQLAPVEPETVSVDLTLDQVARLLRIIDPVTMPPGYSRLHDDLRQKLRDAKKEL